MKVNGQEADAGCYIAGHHGQYGIDMLADVIEQFGGEFGTVLDNLDIDDDPRYWRRAADAETIEDAVHIPNGPGRLGAHIASPEECWERHIWAADKCEEWLNERTEDAFWSWQDGEFFLTRNVPDVDDLDIDPDRALRAIRSVIDVLINNGEEWDSGTIEGVSQAIVNSGIEDIWSF